MPDALVGDNDRLRQVLTNLVSNAIKFTEHGDIAIRVEKEAQTGNEVFLHFSVSDTGIGIPEDKQALIFEAFTQADGSFTRTYGGTGLGLAICSKLVNLMGGRIWVESEAGRGSTFHFTARFGVQENAQVTPARSGASAFPSINIPRERPRPPHRLHILIAEDNVVNQTLIARLLEKRGYSSVIAENGRQAVATLAAERFDAVLMDMQMPEMNGFEATAAIRP